MASHSVNEDNFSRVISRLQETSNTFEETLQSGSKILDNQFSALIQLGIVQQNPEPANGKDLMAQGASVGGAAGPPPTTLQQLSNLINRINRQIERQIDQNSAHDFLRNSLESQLANGPGVGKGLGEGTANHLS